MKASRQLVSWFLLGCVSILVFLLVGHAGAAAPVDQAAREKAFLASPDVAIADLVETMIEKLDFPKNRQPSFLRRMQQQNRLKVKTAEITVAGHLFRVIVGENPTSEFYLHDVVPANGPYWWGSWSLHSYHKIGEKFYEFMLVEDGEKIAGRVYGGPMGTITVGKGGRDIGKAEFNGSVHAKDSVSAPIGVVKDYWTDPVAECQIPVGDYAPYLIAVTYDDLRIEISNNYHTDAQGRPRGGREMVCGMQVRQDKPYVLDFSNKPVVVFDQPAKGKTTFSRGAEIKFAAVLVDPILDVMIRGLDDTSVKVDREYKDSSGKVIQTAKVDKSLDPKVVITRSDGEVVAEGVMPFG